MLIRPLTDSRFGQDAWIGVYDAAVEAIFLCYMVDQEENDGVVRPHYASAALRGYMELYRPCFQLSEAVTSTSPDPKEDEAETQNEDGLAADVETENAIAV